MKGQKDSRLTSCVTLGEWPFVKLSSCNSTMGRGYLESLDVRRGLV